MSEGSSMMEFILEGSGKAESMLEGSGEAEAMPLVSSNMIPLDEMSSEVEPTPSGSGDMSTLEWLQTRRWGRFQSRIPSLHATVLGPSH